MEIYDEREKLVMRILIDDKKENLTNKAYFLPWHSNVTCHNFKVPVKHIYPENLDSIKRPSYVETLVINCDIQDYNFIRNMKNLLQLYIYTGSNLTDLTFIEGLVKLKQLCIFGSHITSLESLKKLIEAKYTLYKELSKEEELRGCITLSFEGICIQTDVYDNDGLELLKPDICCTDIIVNKHHITYKDIITNPEVRNILFGNM